MLNSVRFHNKLDMFVTRSRDTQVFVVKALVTVWDQFNLISAFLPFQILLPALQDQGRHSGLFAPNWTRRAWYSDILWLIADALWAL